MHCRMFTVCRGLVTFASMHGYQLFFVTKRKKNVGGLLGIDLLYSVYRVLQNLCNRLGAQGVLLYELWNISLSALNCVMVVY